MRKIMIFGDQRLASALKRILGEDAVAQTRDMASLRGEASVAVVRVHRAAELEPMRGRMRPFVAILDAADDRSIECAAACGAEYVFFAPVPVKFLAERLRWLASERERPSRAIFSNQKDERKYAEG